jgi:hypothetical protein
VKAGGRSFPEGRRALPDGRVRAPSQLTGSGLSTDISGRHTASPCSAGSSGYDYVDDRPGRHRALGEIGRFGLLLDIRSGNRIANALYFGRDGDSDAAPKTCVADTNRDRVGPVMLYFFNIKNHISTQDDVGTELANLECARVEALKDIVDIKGCRSTDLGTHWPEWSIEVCDDAGDVLLVVPFSPN